MQTLRLDYLTKWQPKHEELWLKHVAQNNKNKIHIRHNTALVVTTATRTQPH
jgi:hypothetical protein